MKPVASSIKQAFILFGLSALFLIPIRRAEALPLVSEAAGTYADGIITIYPDHQDSNKFYYFPNSTKFSVDEQNIPLFNFAYYGLGVGSTATSKGGYMSFSTHLDLSAAAKTSVENFLSTHPQAQLAVLPVKRSTVGLHTDAKDPNGKPVHALNGLFSEFNFSKVGGRAEDEIGVNAVLTETGARAFKALFLETPGGQPIKMDYCYVFEGLGPNMDATLSVDMRRIYDYFEARSSGGYWWFSYSISKAVETLYEQHAITLKMNGGDAKEWEYINSLAQTITQRLFKPELSATPNVGEANPSYPLRLSAGSIHKEELKNETWTWVRRDLVEREFCTSINIKDLGPYKNQLIVDADKN